MMHQPPRKAALDKPDLVPLSAGCGSSKSPFWASLTAHKRALVAGAGAYRRTVIVTCRWTFMVFRRNTIGFFRAVAHENPLAISSSWAGQSPRKMLPGQPLPSFGLALDTRLAIERPCGLEYAGGSLAPARSPVPINSHRPRPLAPPAAFTRRTALAGPQAGRAA